MGRELKRVPLTFAWPLNQVWKGYTNPYYQQCPVCAGSGSTTGRRRLEDLIRLLMLSGDDARKGRCHPYFTSMDGLHGSEGVTPSADLAELTQALAGREPSFLGHDACDQWTAFRKILKAAKLPKTWGLCPACKGHGIEASVQHKYNAWKPKEPPTGDGYQIWETTSEGSPISPVFATPSDLARYMADHSTVAYDSWMTFILGDGWAPTFVMQNGRLTSGVEASAQKGKKGGDSQ